MAAERESVFDWALTKGEWLAVMYHIKATPWSAEMIREGVDADYDVLAVLRAVFRDIPGLRLRGSL